MIKIVIVYMGQGLYKHWALLSERTHQGRPLLISNTLRNGTVKEETWDQVVGHRPYKIITLQTGTPAYIILAKARGAIDQVKYDLIQYNCEHFVREMVFGMAKSHQVSNVLTFTGVAAGVLYLGSRMR